MAIRASASPNEIANPNAPNLGVRKNAGTSGVYIDLRDYKSRVAVLKMSGDGAFCGVSSTSTTPETNDTTGTNPAPESDIAERYYEKQTESFTISHDYLWVAAASGTVDVDLFVR
jgi:hypothetical protein